MSINTRILVVKCLPEGHMMRNVVPASEHEVSTPSVLAIAAKALIHRGQSVCVESWRGALSRVRVAVGSH
jgi:hypothetical protein